MKSPATLLKPALKLLAYGTLGCTSLVEAASGGNLGLATNATLLAILGGAALKSAGTLAGELSGSLLHDLLFGGTKSGDNLTHQTVIGVTGEALGRSLAKIAVELQQSGPDNPGAEKLNEFIRRHGVTQLQSRWHSFVTEQIRPQLLNLSGSELLKELGNETLLQEEQLAQLVTLLTSDGDNQESYLEDEFVNDVAARLLKELPGSFVDVLTDEHSGKPYRQRVIEMLAEIKAEQDKILYGVEELKAGQKELLDRVSPPRFDVPHQLPAPPPDFTGREDELNELRALVKGGSVTISSLHGMGGVGKTALALKLADEFKDDYPDGQIYLDLKGVSRLSESSLRQEPLTAVEVMSHVIHAWHPEEKLADRETELPGLYRTVLADKRVLLLLDNAKDEAQVAPLIPNSNQCLLLITSRQRFRVGGRDPVDIDKLKPEDAVKLLRGISARLSEQDAATVAKLCDHLPMALRPAASLLKRTLPPERLIERLKDKKQRLSLKDVARGDELLNISIEASFELSYELLAETDLGDLQQQWRALAVFPDTFDAAAAAAVWEMDEGAAHDALTEQNGYSLLEFNQDTARFRLHDLARDFADARMSEEERAAAQFRHAQRFRDVLAEAGDLYLAGGERIKTGLAIFDRERANIEAGMAWVASQIEANREAAELCIDYIGPLGVNFLLGLRLFPRERIHWLERQLVATRRLQRRRYEGIVLGNLGIAHADLGDSRKAIEFCVQALIISREIGDRRNEGIWLGNLGLAYAAFGEQRKAIEFYGQALLIAREIGDLRDEESWLGNLGLAYTALGEPRKAIEFYERALLIAREIGDWHGEGNALGNLGIAYKNLGEPRKAIEFYEQHRDIAREIGDRRGEGNTLWNMALTLDELGERGRAVECAESALKIREEIEDPRAAKVRVRLAEWRGQS